ncbi:hypothetical protein H4582DRAFT_981829 [Lactarius indigo]|nr:hypothetical protein H4582DRAFT_981829 [Lactarius indigo]
MLVADYLCRLAPWQITRFVCSFDVVSALSVSFSPIFFSSLPGCRRKWWMSRPVNRCPGAFSISYLRTYERATLTSRHWIVDFLRSLPSRKIVTSSTRIVSMFFSRLDCYYHHPPSPLMTRASYETQQNKLFSCLVCYYSPSPILTYSHSMYFFQSSVSAPSPPQYHENVFPYSDRRSLMYPPPAHIWPYRIFDFMCQNLKRDSTVNHFQIRKVRTFPLQGSGFRSRNPLVTT